MGSSVSFKDVASLLNHYGFEPDGQSIEELVESWQLDYPSQWVRLAAIEALYQGRYKLVSVGQILATWKRRGHTIYHFNHEFERLINRKVPPRNYILPPAFLNSSTHTSVSSHLPTVSASNYATSARSATSEEADYILTSHTAPSPEISEDIEQYEPDYIDDVETTASESNSEPSLLELSANFPDRVEDTQDLSARSINQFTPTPDRSDLYFKLMVLSGETHH